MHWWLDSSTGLVAQQVLGDEKVDVGSVFAVGLCVRVVPAGMGAGTGLRVLLLCHSRPGSVHEVVLPPSLGVSREQPLVGSQLTGYWGFPKWDECCWTESGSVGLSCSLASGL